LTYYTYKSGFSAISLFHWDNAILLNKACIKQNHVELNEFLLNIVKSFVNLIGCAAFLVLTVITLVFYVCKAFEKLVKGGITATISTAAVTTVVATSTVIAAVVATVVATSTVIAAVVATSTVISTVATRVIVIATSTI
jgi:hypothetical protein